MLYTAAYKTAVMTQGLYSSRGTTLLYYVKITGQSNNVTCKGDMNIAKYL